jgi:hypothetical protein
MESIRKLCILFINYYCWDLLYFLESIYICYSKKEIRKKKKKHKPYPNRPTRGPTPNPSTRALDPPCGRRLLLPLPQPPPTLSSSLSLHAPNSLRAPVIHRASLATRLLPCSLRICPLGDLAWWLCASTPDRRRPHLHKPTPSPSPLRHRPARLLCQWADQPRLLALSLPPNSCHQSAQLRRPQCGSVDPPLAPTHTTSTARSLCGTAARAASSATVRRPSSPPQRSPHPLFYIDQHLRPLSGCRRGWGWGFWIWVGMKS